MKMMNDEYEMMNERQIVFRSSFIIHHSSFIIHHFAPPLLFAARRDTLPIKSR
jgi:hypothetical protein